MSIEYTVPTTVTAPNVALHNSKTNQQEDIERNNNLCCTVSYVNATPTNVSITDRLGFSVIIRPSTVLNSGDFCIYVSYQIGNNSILNPYSLIKQAEADLSPDLKVIKIALEKDKNINKQAFGNSAQTIQIVYRIPFTLFAEHDGCINIEQLGISLSNRKDSGIIINPDSDKGKTLLDGRCDLPGFMYRVEINDPDRTYGMRYINVSGRVFRIDAGCDKTKPEGVYVFTNANEVRATEKFKNRYDFIEADDKLKLYRTFEEALHYGNEALERERIYESAKHDARMEILENEKEKSTVNTQNAIMKSILERFANLEENSKRQFDAYMDVQSKADKEREEQRRREREDDAKRREAEREERAQERKEKLEYLKWCTAAAGAITAALLVLSKLPKS